MKPLVHTRRLRRAALPLAAAALACLTALPLTGCGSEPRTAEAPAERPADTVALLVKRVSRCARLYTTAYDIRKIVTHDDRLHVKGRVFSHDVSFDPPLGERKAAIPIDVTLKAYVDLSSFGPQNVERTAGRITLTLPDPQVVVTSSRVDHAGTRQYIDPMRRRYTDAEMAAFARQGTDSILAHVDRYGIVEDARLTATRALMPILRGMGYGEESVTIQFRKDFTAADLNRSVTVENHPEQ